MKKEFYEEIREIYDLLQDDLSKRVFAGRLLYSLTHDMRYMLDVVCTTHAGKSIYTRMKCNDKKKIIFGAGVIGKKLVDIFYDVDFECFADNNHAGDTCKGLTIVNVETLKNKYSDALIIISTAKYSKEILEQLLHEGFKEENIINIGNEYKKLNHLQYFDLPEIKKTQTTKEVFVDGGCYDGINTIEFQKWCEKNETQETFAYAWEPDPQSVNICKNNLETHQIPHTIINKGVWSQKSTLYFESDKKSSAISPIGTLTVEVDSIDNIVKQPVTYIKLDVEGSEYQALLGAENTIKSQKPRLAVCIYHKPEDIWELPLLVHKFNPDYKFYLRHYSFADNETVLYAIDCSK